MAENQEKIAEYIRSLQETLEQVEGPAWQLFNVAFLAGSLRPPTPENYEEYSAMHDAIASVINLSAFAEANAHTIGIKCFEMIQNLKLYYIFVDNEAYDQAMTTKKELASEINALCRKISAALHSKAKYHPQPPHILVVITSRDGKGRYAYEDRATKKRIGSYASLKSMLPLEFVRDLPRDWKMPEFKHLSE
ncbi:MAG TPA: hypothetical protein VJV04_02170 [Nitrospiraceae bacterium]|nr:hypothetical protein [Nitrospiraceae bacterium]